VPNPRPLLAVALALALAACSSTAPSGGASRTPVAASASVGPSSTLPASTDASSGNPTEAPAETEPAPTDEPAEPTGTAPAETLDPGETVDPSPSPGATDAPAAACSGSDANREFYGRAAAAVDWTVLCAVLPKGWYVSAGSYRMANGGRLVIGYKGPAGATIELSEGAFCADATGCLPSGTDGGEAPLGPMTGTLVRLAAGGSAVVVDRGLNPSWQLVTHGLDEATSLAFAAAVAAVSRPG
jgi:hypothetical protein